MKDIRIRLGLIKPKNVPRLDCVSDHRERRLNSEFCIVSRLEVFHVNIPRLYAHHARLDVNLNKIYAGYTKPISIYQIFCILPH